MQRERAIARVDTHALPFGGDAREADQRRGSVADQVAWMEREGLVPGQRPTKRQIRDPASLGL